MAKASLYPPNPENVPDDLTEPSAEYRTQTFMLLLSLVLFFLLYFGLMLFSAMYMLWAIWFFLGAAGHNPLLRFFSLCFVPLALTLFVYMLKNLFKSEHAEKEFQIEIFEDEHPKLFEFIHQLCDDVGVDPPLHVYVDYNVNAYAAADRSSFFHLLIPTGRSLCIGMGLINCVNLTEFKALLAHEFGHFSQKGMKISTYVAAALRIVNHVLTGEDAFDRFIVGWSQGPVIFAWPAYIIRGILWALRKIMDLLAYVVFFFHLSLARQREFHADSVAVALTGSDAPVYLLHRCYIGEYSFHQAVNDLRSAMSQHLYTSDLFYHQSASVKVVRKRNKGKDLHLEEPPELPRDPDEQIQLFKDDDDDKLAEMWESHPSNYDREQNAKAHYIRSTFDHRSPWLLFDNVEELRERVTYKFYRFYFKIPKDVILADPIEVQGFIDDEHADRTYDPKYQGLYDFRNLLLDDITELAKDGSRQPWSITELAETHATLYNAEVKHRSQLYYKRVEEKNMLVAVYNGWQKPKNDEIEFRGDIYEIDDAKRLIKKVEKEIEKDHRWIKAHDLRVFMTYFQMALHINQEVAEELYRRYAFHMELQNIWYELTKQNDPIQSAIAFLDTVQGPIQSHHFRELLTIFRDAHKAMKKSLTASKGMTLPALKNMPVGQELRPFLLEKNLLEGLSKYDNTITQRWVNKLLDQFREMREKVDRVHFKSLAGILGLQEKIGDECTRRWSSLPTVRSL